MQPLFMIFFGLFFCAFFAVFGLILIRGIREWRHNEKSPRLTVPARVVAKRTQVGHHAGTGSSMGTSYTRYFATFEVESGDRMELPVSGSDYGMLVEGDTGKLTFQGTRFLSFE